ncbi:hypothetical protein F441_05141 [Phytophthora nicotianae CJ01A1]|uniref:Uncharacterized protein n=1 Tax=Phytophthora nicotianae CJ01A1 TaxID=1317063 RepID=W2XF63_PHYNI|nr:hypothetical protein F441_05141 [Phytophthora nicotianae CJ01A1]
MKDLRRTDQALTTTRIAQFIRENYFDWLTDYTTNKRDTAAAYDSLLHLLRRCAYRHGFVQRTPHGLKENREDLIETQRAFSEVFKTNMETCLQRLLSTLMRRVSILTHRRPEFCASVEHLQILPRPKSTLPGDNYRFYLSSEVNLTLFNTKLGWIVMFGLRIYVP